MLSRLPISWKLALLVIVALVAFLITQGYSLLNQSHNTDRLNEVHERLFPTMEVATINLGQLKLMQARFSSAVITGNDEKITEAQTHYQTIKENLGQLRDLNPTMNRRLNGLEGDLDTYFNNAQRIAKGFISGDADMGKLSQQASENAERLEQLTTRVTVFREETRATFEESIAQTVKTSRKSATVGLIIMVGAIAVLVVLSLLITRSITSGLNRIIRSLHEMASGQGDLSSRIEYDGADELGELVSNFNAFIAKLHEAFSAMVSDVDALHKVASRLAEASSTNLEQMQEQSGEIGSTRHSIDELVKSVDEVARFAEQASEQTQNSAELAARGKDQVAHNVTTIEQLGNDIEESAKLVNDFENHSSRVAGLLDTIKTVTEQTNLLALNAAIEAARAGEHGRGFAVVADEVRNLAVRTQQSAGEIETVISELSSLAESSVKSMQDCVNNARSGVEATKESGEMLENILGNVDNIRSINEQIAAATHEQNMTFSEVVGHITSIHDNAEKVMQSTREVDQISHDTREVSNRIEKIASQFRV